MKISTLLTNLKALLFKSGLPASTAEIGVIKPLKLNLQFFSEDPDDKDKGDSDPDKTKDPDGKTDPDGTQEDEVTLNELFKAHPNLKTEYTSKFTKDFNKRLKGLDLEEARKAVALMEKLGLDSDGNKKEEGKDKDKQPAAPDNSKLNKFEKKAKDLSLKLFASDEGYNAKLIAALASSRLDDLDLNEDGELDKEDLEEIVEDLKADFPDAFLVKGEDAEDKKDGKKKSPGPSGRQKMNPPPKKPDAAQAARDRMARLRPKKKD